MSSVLWWSNTDSIAPRDFLHAHSDMYTVDIVPGNLHSLNPTVHVTEPYNIFKMSVTHLGGSVPN